MSFAASWYRASCALLLLTLYFSMFSFYLPFLLSLSLSPSFSLSLSPSPSFSLSVSLSFSLSMSLCGCKTRVIWCRLPNILFLINLTFHTLSLHSAYKIHQPFTDYLLRLPSSELLEKHFFRSRANRRLVCFKKCKQIKYRTKWDTFFRHTHARVRSLNLEDLGLSATCTSMNIVIAPK